MMASLLNSTKKVKLLHSKRRIKGIDMSMICNICQKYCFQDVEEMNLISIEGPVSFCINMEIIKFIGSVASPHVCSVAGWLVG